MSAIDDLKFLANRFQGVLELLPKLESLEVLENQLVEFRNSIEVKKQEILKASADLKWARGEFVKVQEAAEAEKANAAKAAQAYEDAAKARAAKIIDDAVAVAKDTVARGENEYRTYQDKIKNTENAAVAASAKLAEEQAKLATVQTELAALKRKF